MNFVYHLTELRARLISCFIIFISAFGLCWFFSENILKWAALPISPYLEQSQGLLIFTAPMDDFLAHIRAAVFGALVLSFPAFMLHIWKFLSPGLYKKEKIFFISLNIIGSLLFFAGVLFVYFVV